MHYLCWNHKLFTLKKNECRPRGKKDRLCQTSYICPGGPILHHSAHCSLYQKYDLYELYQQTSGVQWVWPLKRSRKTSQRERWVNQDTCSPGFFLVIELTLSLDQRPLSFSKQMTLHDILLCDYINCPFHYSFRATYGNSEAKSLVTVLSTVVSLLPYLYK